MASDQGEQEREVVVQPTSSTTNSASPPLRSDDSTDEINDSVDSQRADESDNSADQSVSSGGETGSEIEESSYMEDDNQDDSVNITSDSMADANESSLILSVGRPERVMDPSMYRSTVIIDSDESESESGEEEDSASEGTHPDTDNSYVEVVDSSCREEEEEEERGGEEEEEEETGCEEETGEEEEEEKTEGEEEEEEERGGEEEEEERGGGEEVEEERGGEEVEEEETGVEEEEEKEVEGDEDEEGGESPRAVETVYDQSLSSVETSTDNADLHLTKEGSCVSPDSGVSLQEGSEGLSKLSLEKSSVSRHSLTDSSPQKEIEVLDTTSSSDGDSGSTCISPGADASHEPDMDETDYHRPGLSNQAKPSLTDVSSKGHRREGMDKPEPQFKVGYQYRTLVKQLEQMEVSREGGGGG